MSLWMKINNKHFRISHLSFAFAFAYVSFYSLANWHFQHTQMTRDSHFRVKKSVRLAQKRVRLAHKSVRLAHKSVMPYFQAVWYNKK